MKSTVIYLSGRYSGDIHKNIRAAREVAVQLWGEGYPVVCPHLNTAHFEVDCSAKYDDYIAGDLFILNGCDGVVMLPGWEDSKGARIEKEHAEALGIPVAVWPDIPVMNENPASPYKSILLEADELVGGARGAAYGHPLDDFSRTAKIWGAILGIDVKPEQVGLCMIGVKISRECNLPKRDNMVDTAGYAKTVDMVKEERKRREGNQ
jgi:hypothetical protein